MSLKIDIGRESKVDRGEVAEDGKHRDATVLELDLGC
jgi:hypothetical protein